MKNILIAFSFIVAGATAFSQQLSTIQNHRPQVKNKLRAKTIILPGNVNLEYVETGTNTGNPVIFLHGISDSWHSFESTLKLLPSSVHAFAISLRGHGNSSKLHSSYTIKDFANDVANFIEKKRLGKVIIAGHSMGGLVAQQFALDHPSLTKAVVVISSDACFKDNAGMPEFYQEVLQIQDTLSYDFMDAFQKATLAKPINEDYYRLLVTESMKPTVTVFRNAFTDIMDTDLTDSLKKLNKPVLLLWGDKDGFIAMSDQDQLVKQIKNAKLVIYKGTGHALHWEEPNRFVSDLLNFVQLVNY